MLNGSSLAVLMYHTLSGSGGVVAADPQYAVTRGGFIAQLQAIAGAGLEGTSLARLVAGVARTRTVALTFDDGHASNRAAAEALAANGWSADFFVNPTTIGTPHHLAWDDLRAMAMLGMSIQSHGQRHRYLDELTAREVRDELVDSKREIEDRVGRAVTVFAPAGGRLGSGLADAAARAGYAAVCTSRADVWRTGDDVWAIPRFAVLRTTSDARFARWIEMDWREVTAQRARYLALASAKRLLGNQGYERLRLGLLRDAGS